LKLSPRSPHLSPRSPQLSPRSPQLSPRSPTPDAALLSPLPAAGPTDDASPLSSPGLLSPRARQPLSGSDFSDEAPVLSKSTRGDVKYAPVLPNKGALKRTTSHVLPGSGDPYESDNAEDEVQLELAFSGTCEWRAVGRRRCMG
jgi:hypothetical protein